MHLANTMNPTISKLLHLWVASVIATSSSAWLSHGKAAPPQKSDPKMKDLSGELASLPRKFGVPGVSVVAIRDGRIVASGSAGVRQIGRPKPIRNEDRFHLGSCTKLMTSLMIFRLVDEGKLSLDTRLGKILKDVPMRNSYRNVTVRQLIQFKAGIQPYLMISPDKTPAVFATAGTSEQQRKAFVAHVLQEAPVSVPGTKAVYSNADYAVLACVASQATGKPWEKLMIENVFDPLQMSSAGFGRPYSAATPSAPRGHIQTPSGLEPEPSGYIHPASLSAAGDVSASMSDFAKFAAEEVRIANGKSKILSKKTSNLMKTAMAFEEGRTFFGGAGAFTAGITLWPSRDCAVVAAVNSGGGEELCRQVSAAVERTVANGTPFSLANSSRPQGYGFALALGDGGAVIVQGVAPGSIAADSGLKSGDQIIEMNGQGIDKMQDEKRFGALRGTPLVLKVKRKNAILLINMKLS